VRQLAVFVLTLGGFGIGTNEFVSMRLPAHFTWRLGATESTAGQAISAYALGVVVGVPAPRRVAARVPRRSLLMTLFTISTQPSRI
jgi:DHA1 family inner membrane transport protein